MLLSVRYLLDRVRHPRSRAQELALVRARFEGHEGASDEERAVALELLALREQLSGLLRDTVSCSRCARGLPAPAGQWDGGDCCSTATERLFSHEECATLAVSGVLASQLEVPRAEHAGCVFRGPQGCTLTTAQRPNVCVRHVCKGLRAELDQQGKIAEVERLREAIAQGLERFSSVRRAREDHAVFTQWLGKFGRP